MSTIETVVAEIALMRRDFAALVHAITPWIGTDEMKLRYGVKDPKTLVAMELRGEIPLRAKGRWNRAEVMQWEAAQSMRRAA